MTIIDTSYKKEKVRIELTKGEIEEIIDCLERVEHNIFTFFNYQKIIDKLKKKK